MLAKKKLVLERQACIFNYYHSIFWGTLKGTSQSNTLIKWSQKVAVVCDNITGLRSIPAHFGAIMPETLGESTPPSATASAGAKKQKARQTQEMDIQQRSRRTAQQSREYELIWLLQQRLMHAVSWPHWRLCCMKPLLGHGMRELTGLNHSHAATPQHVTRASCAQLLRSMLGSACR